MSAEDILYQAHYEGIKELVFIESKRNGNMQNTGM